MISKRSIAIRAKQSLNCSRARIRMENAQSILENLLGRELRRLEYDEITVKLTQHKFEAAKVIAKALLLPQNDVYVLRQIIEELDVNENLINEVFDKSLDLVAAAAGGQSINETSPEVSIGVTDNENESNKN